MACPPEPRRRRRSAAPVRPERAPLPAAAERAWRKRLLEAELRGIEAGLITASRGTSRRD